MVLSQLNLVQDIGEDSFFLLFFTHLISLLFGNLTGLICFVVGFFRVEVFQMFLNLRCYNVLLVPLVFGLIFPVKLPKLVPVSLLTCLIFC